VEIPRPIENRHLELAAAPTPIAALAAARGLREALQLWETDLANEAVAAGVTWEALGAALGVSRQAAWERYSKASHRGRGHQDDDTDELGDVRSLRRDQRRALADARAQLRDARRAVGEERARRLADARQQREDALGLLSRKEQD
jgi:hypothetical protein